MKTPVLDTKRLLLRPLTCDDAETVFINWTSDAEVAKFMRWKVHTDVTQTREWLAAEESSIGSDMVYNWGFVLKETGELIGSGGLVYQESKGMYELGYNIMKKYWNHGFTTEAAAAMIAFGKDVLHQKTFYCCHAKDNPASGKVMQKIGFQYQNDGVYSSWNGSKQFESREYLLVVE